MQDDHDDSDTPGWDAINAALAPLYAGQPSQSRLERPGDRGCLFLIEGSQQVGLLPLRKIGVGVDAGTALNP